MSSGGVWTSLRGPRWKQHTSPHRAKPTRQTPSGIRKERRKSHIHRSISPSPSLSVSIHPPVRISTSTSSQNNNNNTASSASVYLTLRHSTTDSQPCVRLRERSAVPRSRHLRLNAPAILQTDRRRRDDHNAITTLVDNHSPLDLASSYDGYIAEPSHARQGHLTRRPRPSNPACPPTAPSLPTS